MSLTGTRIFLVAAPAFFLGMVAGGAVMYQRSSLFAVSETWELTFQTSASGCTPPPDTTIAVTRVASIVRAVQPAGVGGKGFVEQGNLLRADLNRRNLPLVTLQGQLGKSSADNVWRETEGPNAATCQGTWSATASK